MTENRSIFIVELLQHCGRVLVFWIEFQSFFVVNRRLFLIPAGQIGFAEAVINVGRLRIQLDVDLEDRNRFGDSVFAEQ